MNCTHCNAALPEGAKVCEYCDCPIEAKKSGNRKRRVIGILYAAAAFLLILLPFLGSDIMGDKGVLLTRLIQSEYGAMDDTAAAFSIILSAVDSLDYTVFSAAGLMMAVAALALLLNKKGAYKAAVTSGIAGLAAVCYASFMIIVMSAFPQLLVSAYTPEEQIVEIAAKIIRSEPVFIARCIVAALCTAALIIPTFILTVKARKSGTDEPAFCKKMERSTASLMTLLPLLSIVLRLKDMMKNLFAVRMGADALAASGIADAAVANFIGVSAVMLLIITVYCVLMKKFRYPLFIFPGLGALMVYGIYGLLRCFSQKDMYTIYGREDVYGMVGQAVIPKAFGVILLLVAVYFWIAATARGGMRAWGQIIFAVSFIILVFMLETIMVTVLKMGFSFPLAEIVIGSGMLAAAIPLSIRKREN